MRGHGSAAIVGARASRGASTACGATMDCGAAARMGRSGSYAMWAGASWRATCVASPSAWRRETADQDDQKAQPLMTALACLDRASHLAARHFAAQNSTKRKQETALREMIPTRRATR